MTTNNLQVVAVLTVTGNMLTVFSFQAPWPVSGFMSAAAMALCAAAALIAFRKVFKR